MLKNYLSVVDYCVVAGTLLFSLGIGVFYAIRGKKSNNEELLAGGRSMGAIPVAISVLVTFLSSITILGIPSEVYAYGSQIYVHFMLGIVTTPLAVIMFVRTMYDLKLTSAYKYLELRYDSIVIRCGSSFIFIVQLLFLNGIVLYAPAIAMETMMGIPKTYTVIAIGICGTVYTSIGGIRAVVWTDVFQFCMIFVGMSAILIRGIVSAGGFGEMFRVASEGGRLQIFDWTIDPFMRHNTLNLVLGNVFTVCYTCNQQIVQRYCGLSSYREAVKSSLWNWFLQLGTYSLVILTGIAIYARYANCDPLTANLIVTSDQIVPYFVVQELAFIPGMMGLFAAVIFSAVLSTISSTLNSLAAVTWEDFLSKIGCFDRMGDFAQATTYKIITILYGTISVLLSFYAGSLGGLIQSVITIFSTAAGVKGSLFLMGMFFPFVNKHGALCGMLVGVTAMGYLSISANVIGREYDINPKLPMSIGNCSDMDNFFNSTSTSRPPKLGLDVLEFPEKIFSVSYTLYSLIGGCLTMIVAMIVSILTGGCRDARFVRPEYLHPTLRPQKMSFTPELIKVEVKKDFVEEDDKVTN